MKEKFGTTKSGESCNLYWLRNENGMEAAVTDYGAAIVRVLVPGRNGQKTDVVLGYDDVAGYENGSLFAGAVIGRVANRIGGAAFELNGKTYRLTANDQGNALHGGRDFLNQRKWETIRADEREVAFHLWSPDGDQGFPGDLDLQVTYSLSAENELKIHYEARVKEDTLLNLTNHSYFNLSGHASGSVEEQEVEILADAYTESDEQSIPTGRIVPVEGTPMDFRIPKKIGRDLGADYRALVLAGGYDHNYVLNGSGMRKAASMTSGESGIRMEVYTDLPGMQFYTANFVAGEKGKEGAVYEKYGAACFETQYFPDAVNKENFETPLIRAGEAYQTTTIYRFS